MIGAIGAVDRCWIGRGVGASHWPQLCCSNSGTRIAADFLGILGKDGGCEMGDGMELGGLGGMRNKRSRE